MFGITQPYKWELNEGNFTFIHPYFVGVEVENEFIEIKDGILTIFDGYAWNGCSPKFSIFGLKIVGTLDGEVYYKTGKQKAYYPSLVHDAMCQFMPIRRKEADIIFKEMLEYYEFTLAPLYYAGVRTFGIIKGWIKG